MKLPCLSINIIGCAISLMFVSGKPITPAGSSYFQDHSRRGKHNATTSGVINIGVPTMSTEQHPNASNLLNPASANFIRGNIQPSRTLFTELDNTSSIVKTNLDHSYSAMISKADKTFFTESSNAMNWLYPSSASHWINHKYSIDKSLVSSSLNRNITTTTWSHLTTHVNISTNLGIPGTTDFSSPYTFAPGLLKPSPSTVLVEQSQTSALQSTHSVLQSSHSSFLPASLANNVYNSLTNHWPASSAKSSLVSVYDSDVTSSNAPAYKNYLSSSLVKVDSSSITSTIYQPYKPGNTDVSKRIQPTAVQPSTTESVILNTSFVSSIFTSDNTSFTVSNFSRNSLASNDLTSNTLTSSSLTGKFIRPSESSSWIATSASPLGFHKGSPPAIGDICSKMDSYFPKYIEMDESDSVGTVLTIMPFQGRSHNVTFEVGVTEPQQLTQFMKGYFGVQISKMEIALTLLKPVDVEKLYQLTGKTIAVKDIQLEVECREEIKNVMFKETMTINMTIWDTDDEMPQFQNQDSNSNCVVPVYKADASEDYLGELTVKPGKIKAVDGDLFSQHNISYAVMHGEPENYDAYFQVSNLDGTVNKTRGMNASDPRKYVIFIQAIEDSAQQKKKVAVLSIEVLAPADPLMDDTPSVDPTVKLSLKLASALVLMGFVSGLIVIVHHRWRRKTVKTNPDRDEISKTVYDVKLPILAVYSSSHSSLECEHVEETKNSKYEVPSISSPSQVQFAQVVNAFTKKKRKVIVKKPIDTNLRPGWNAPAPKKKPVVYSPYTSVQSK